MKAIYCNGAKLCRNFRFTKNRHAWSVFEFIYSFLFLFYAKNTLSYLFGNKGNVVNLRAQSIYMQFKKKKEKD